jgi:hypothetical protein
MRHEARHDLVDRHVRVRRLRIPEVLRGRIRIQVRLQVVVHALPEGLFADVVFNHADNGARLAICNAVEHLVDLVWRIRGGANGSRRLRASTFSV